MSVTLEICHPLTSSPPSTRENRCPSVGFLAPWVGHYDGLDEKCLIYSNVLLPLLVLSEKVMESLGSGSLLANIVTGGQT